jgi:imidazoleglycerol phosphate synthase glutamine amidotransferase subunit HisH
MKVKPRIAVIDYGSINLKSVLGAISRDDLNFQIIMKMEELIVVLMKII